jgi:hypothetical protein
LTRNVLPTRQRETVFKMMPCARMDGFTSSTFKTNLRQQSTYGEAFCHYTPGLFGFLTV